MKTINDLGIYFMCCFIFATLFITYLSVKLRAYRIKNAGLTNRIEIADKDIEDAYDAVDRAKLDMSFHRTESAAIINQSAENNAKLVLEIETLKSDRQKLFDIAKGATAKLAEMNIALEGLEVDEKDWSKEAFPAGYDIPNGTTVIVLKESRPEGCPNYRKVGLKGVIIKNGHRFLVDCDWEDGGRNISMCFYELAPLNPLDHPNHPNFRG